MKLKSFSYLIGLLIIFYYPPLFSDEKIDIWNNKKATTPELKAIALSEGFRTMQDMGRSLILNGDLNFREFDRVLSME